MVAICSSRSFGQKMRTAIKTALGVTILVAVLVFGAIAEAFVRSQCGGPMMIAGLPITGAQIEGTWQPDFLWFGRSWRIHVQCESPLEIVMDGKHYIVPVGSHVLYSHHDHTNTGQFGADEFWGYPKRIDVRSLPKKPEPSDAADSR